MFAFAAGRDQGRSKTLYAKRTQTPKHEAIDTLDARIDILSRLLLAVARQHAADANQTRALAQIALRRLMAGDPELSHFWQVLGVLRDELEGGAAEDTAAEPPLRASCLAA